VEGFRLNKAVNTGSLLLPGRLETEEMKYTFALYNVQLYRVISGDSLSDELSHLLYDIQSIQFRPRSRGDTKLLLAHRPYRPHVLHPTYSALLPSTIVQSYR
jgi:hypothetical protein